jgi:flagellar hook-associated protein 1 FlgK
MSGLIGSLQNSSGALRVHSKGLEVAGKNLANINNRGYSKERVEIGDRGSIETGVAFESMGVEAMGLRQNRDALLDKSVMREITSSSSLEAAKKVLESAEIALGQFLDRTKDSTSIQNAPGASGGGISDAITDFFNAWESFSVKPNDVGEKQLLIAKAQILAEKINATDKRLVQVQTDADAQLKTDVGVVNGLLAEIAKTNEYIAKAELVKPFSAVDLRDQRQAKLEELAQYIDVTFEPIVPDGLGQISVKSGNVELINGKNVFGAFEYDADPAKRQFGFDFIENNKTFTATSGLTVGELKLPKDTNGKDMVFGGYPSSPLPTITVLGNNGTGSGAVVEPVVQNGKITSFTVKDAGQGYTMPLTINISAPADVQYSSSSPIAAGKLRAQQEAATDDVQKTRDQIKDLAIQLKQEVNNTYNANGGTGSFFSFSITSTGLLNFQFDASVSPTAGNAGGNKRALEVAELGTHVEPVSTKKVLSTSTNHTLVDGETVTIGNDLKQYKVEVLSDKSFMLRSDKLPATNPPSYEYSVPSGSLDIKRSGNPNPVASVLATGIRTLDFQGSFASNFNKTVTILAQELNTTNIRLEDQKLSQEMAVNNRDQFSGVSQDEEMTDMMKFQRSFQASARHVNVIDTLLEQVVNRLGVG